MKKLVHIVFGIIIALTIGFSMIECMNATGDDIFGKEFEIALVLMFLVFMLIVELGLYYNCIYFFTKKNKKMWKTLYNVLMFIVSCMIGISLCGTFLWTMKIWEGILFCLSGAAIVLWLVYALRCAGEMLEG